MGRQPRAWSSVERPGMLIYSLRPSATRWLTLSMAVILAVYSVYYALDADWPVVAGALICAAALTVLGGATTRSGQNPAAALVLAAMGAINAGAIVGIVGLAVDGAVWLAPVVFVNFLLGGVRIGAGVTVVTVAAIVILGGFYADPDLALNIVGAVLLSLLMAAAYGGAMRAHLSRLESEALRDPLTGLHNRRACESALGELISRGRLPIAVIYLDLDHFKELNDRFGHPVGDRVLQRFAQVASGQLRRSDDLYRHGGEEFMVLLEADLDGALRVAEKIRRAVHRETFHPDFDLTVSAGVAEAAPEEDVRSVVRRADAALYAAKAAGRNRSARAGSGREPRVHSPQPDPAREPAPRQT